MGHFDILLHELTYVAMLTVIMKYQKMGLMPALPCLVMSELCTGRIYWVGKQRAGWPMAALPPAWCNLQVHPEPGSLLFWVSNISKRLDIPEAELTNAINTGQFLFHLHIYIEIYKIHIYLCLPCQVPLANLSPESFRDHQQVELVWINMSLNCSAISWGLSRLDASSVASGKQCIFSQQDEYLFPDH